MEVIENILRKPHEYCYRMIPFLVSIWRYAEYFSTFHGFVGIWFFPFHHYPVSQFHHYAIWQYFILPLFLISSHIYKSILNFNPIFPGKRSQLVQKYLATEESLLSIFEKIVVKDDNLVEVLSLEVTTFQ